MKTKMTLGALGFILAFVVFAQPPTGSPARPDPAIIAKLSEIVSIRERLAKTHEQMVEAGRASATSLEEVDLAEARIALAREGGQPEVIVRELKGLVAAHERRTKRLSALPADRVPGGEVDRAQAALLEAQVRLLRAQK